MEMKGLDELESQLAEIPSKVSKRIIRSALAYAGKPIRKTARAKVPARSGTLKRSIKSAVFIGKGYTDNVAKLIVGTFKGGTAYYAHMIHEGTKPHDIPAKTTGRGESKRLNRVKVKFGGKVYSRVRHPGIKSNPFLLSAFEQEHQNALNAFSARINQMLLEK